MRHHNLIFFHRFGHSLVPNSFMRIENLSPKAKNFGLREKRFRMILSEIFFDPDRVRQSPHTVDELVHGMADQRGHLLDKKFVEDITNHLFERKKGAGGLDLVALNVQRGRDHGLPGYNNYREICDVGRAKNFDDLKDFISGEDVEKLKNLYDHVDDIDLFAGGFLESPHEDSALGPTFKCIIGDTFARIKLGDRFFYDLGPNGPDYNDEARRTLRFSPSQLKEIRKTSMARILCDNTDVMSEIQPSAFKRIGSSRFNMLRNCNSARHIPFVDLSVFKE